MKISVRVKPGSKESLVEKTANNEYILRVKEKALDGRANAAAVRLLAEYLGVSKSTIAILKGHRSRNKVFLIDTH